MSWPTNPDEPRETRPLPPPPPPPPPPAPPGFQTAPQVPPGYGQPGYGQAMPPGPGVPPPTMYGAPPAPPKRQMGGGRKLLIGVTVALALAAGTFAVGSMQASGAGGGSTPEAALENFVDSAANEDLIGVLENLDPAERDVLIPFAKDLESESGRLGMTTDVDLNDVGGLDLEIEGLETTPSELAPGIQEVTVNSGELTYRTEPESVPIGDVLRDLIEANGGEVDIEESSDTVSVAEGEEPVFVIATETDGRWYVSLSYTIAEYARRDGGHDMPDPSAGVAPAGAGSPEEAATQLFEGAAALDLEQVIATLPPDSMRALQQYAPLFLDDAQADLEEMRSEEELEISVDGLEYSTSEVDGGTRVVPTAAEINVSNYEGESTISWADGCISVSGEWSYDFEDEMGSSEWCLDDPLASAEDLSPEEEADFRELTGLFTDMEVGVVTVERDGKHYVDPLRTASDLWFQMVGGVEREDLEEGGILYRLFTGEVFGYDDYDYDSEYGDSEGSDSGEFDEDCDAFEETETTSDDC